MPCVLKLSNISTPNSTQGFIRESLRRCTVGAKFLQSASSERDFLHLISGRSSVFTKKFMQFYAFTLFFHQISHQDARLRSQTVFSDRRSPGSSSCSRFMRGGGVRTRCHRFSCNRKIPQFFTKFGAFSLNPNADMKLN